MDILYSEDYVLCLPYCHFTPSCFGPPESGKLKTRAVVELSADSSARAVVLLVSVLKAGDKYLSLYKKTPYIK